MPQPSTLSEHNESISLPISLFLVYSFALFSPLSLFLHQAASLVILSLSSDLLALSRAFKVCPVCLHVMFPCSHPLGLSSPMSRIALPHPYRSGSSTVTCHSVAAPAGGGHIFNKILKQLIKILPEGTKILSLNVRVNELSGQMRRHGLTKLIA